MRLLVKHLPSRLRVWFVRIQICFLLLLIAPIANAFEHPLDNGEISGIALSPDGTRLVIAFSKSERGSFVVISKDARFETYRKLALPEGHHWLTPAYAPDGTYIALASLCRPESGCKDEEGWNIWRYDLQTDQARQMTRTRQDVIKWRPFVAANDDIYYVAMSDLGDILRSSYNGGAHISVVQDSGEEEEVFPVENPYLYDKRRDRYILRYRGISWGSMEIGFADEMQVIFRAVARNRISNEVVETKAKGRTVAKWEESSDPRINEFAAEMRERWPDNESPHRIFRITDEGIELVEVQTPSPSPIGTSHIYPITSFDNGKLLFQAAEKATLTNALWTLSEGRLEKLFRSDMRGVTAQYFTAADNLGVVAITYRTFIDGSLQVGERVDAPLVIVRDREQSSALATINVE